MIIKKHTTLAFLILSGLFLNIFSPRLFMGFNYLFGSIPVLIILRFYGTGWGTLAGLTAGSWTYVLFGHPYAIIWLTMEPLFIGLMMRYSPIRNIVLLNTIYWPVIGIPLLWVFFKFMMELPFVGTLPAALMFWLIGISNSLAANIIIQITPIARYIEQKTTYPIVTMRQAVFSIIMALVVFTAIIAMVINGRVILKKNEFNIINRLYESGKQYEERLNLLGPSLLMPNSIANNGIFSDHVPLNQIKKSFSEYLGDDINTWVTLIDYRNRIIFTNRPDFFDKKSFSQDTRTESRAVRKDIDHVLPPMPQYKTLWRRVQESWYRYRFPHKGNQRLTWILEIPFAPYQTLLLEQQTSALRFTLFLCIAALGASLMISFFFNRSILKLADITTDLAERVAIDKKINWPNSRLREIKILSDNFKEVANALRLKFRELRQSYDSMEEKVLERTLELQVAKEQAERLYRLMPSALFAVDREHRIITWNKKAEQITGYSADEAVGRKCTSFSIGRCLEKCRLDSGEIIPAEGIECRVACKDGSEITVSKNIDYLLDASGNIMGGIESFEDITEKLKLEEQLRQAQKMESVGRLAGGVAHDFNNMLGVILGHTELALLKADEDNDLISDLQEIQNAAKRSADITKQLLAFARKQTISPRQLDLNDTVESMLNMLRRLIGEDIDLIWQPSAHLWSVKMDPSQIDQILANLCINARDAISGVGKLTIETGTKTFDEEYCHEHPGFIPGDFVLLAVSDNGCGMDKDTLDNLFEPFFTTKDVGKGTGLGLATIYGIVKQNSGFINVYSEPGQGSTFKIYMPRLVADEDIDKAVPEKKAAAGGSETILLVEDEPTILRMTRMMLERKGYSVLSAATPAEAMEKAENHSGTINLLMTDVVMPEMNGRDLAGQITALCPGIRLLFMSGYTANVIAHQGVLDDGVAFIQKPFSMADMTVKVRELLDIASDKS